MVTVYTVYAYKPTIKLKEIGYRVCKYVPGDYVLLVVLRCVGIQYVLDVLPRVDNFERKMKEYPGIGYRNKISLGKQSIL